MSACLLYKTKLASTYSTPSPTCVWNPAHRAKYRSSYPVCDPILIWKPYRRVRVCRSPVKERSSRRAERNDCWSELTVCGVYVHHPTEAHPGAVIGLKLCMLSFCLLDVEKQKKMESYSTTFSSSPGEAIVSLNTFSCPTSAYKREEDVNMVLPYIRSRPGKRKETGEERKEQRRERWFGGVVEHPQDPSG